jgi:hypothetical protein
MIARVLLPTYFGLSAIGLLCCWPESVASVQAPTEERRIEEAEAPAIRSRVPLTPEDQCR